MHTPTTFSNGTETSSNGNLSLRQNFPQWIFFHSFFWNANFSHSGENTINRGAVRVTMIALFETFLKADYRWVAQNTITEVCRGLWQDASVYFAFLPFAEGGWTTSAAAACSLEGYRKGERCLFCWKTKGILPQAPSQFLCKETCTWLFTAARRAVQQQKLCSLPGREEPCSALWE